MAGEIDIGTFKEDINTLVEKVLEGKNIGNKVIQVLNSRLRLLDLNGISTKNGIYYYEAKIMDAYVENDWEKSVLAFGKKWNEDSKKIKGDTNPNPPTFFPERFMEENSKIKKSEWIPLYAGKFKKSLNTRSNQHVLGNGNGTGKMDLKARGMTVESGSIKHSWAVLDFDSVTYNSLISKIEEFVQNHYCVIIGQRG